MILQAGIFVITLPFCIPATGKGRRTGWGACSGICAAGVWDKAFAADAADEWSGESVAIGTASIGGEMGSVPLSGLGTVDGADGLLGAVGAIVLSSALDSVGLATDDAHVCAADLAYCASTFSLMVLSVLLLLALSTTLWAVSCSGAAGESAATLDALPITNGAAALLEDAIWALYGKIRAIERSPAGLANS